MSACAYGMRVDWMQRLRGIAKVAAGAGLLVVAPFAVQALTPVVLTLVEILLGLGQACVTFLRATGF